MDADYAAESTKLATLQIIHESSSAMLAKYNLSKQAVLNLLPKN